MNEVNHPFWVIVNKEISDHVKSWRFIILIGIIALMVRFKKEYALQLRTELSPLLRCLSTFWDLY